MQNAVINVNGQILSPDEAKVSVFDRGYLYGDSLYEVIRSYQGQFLLMNEHLERLQKSAALCQMPLGQTLEQYRNEINRTFKTFQALPHQGNSEAYVRLIVSRGVGKIGFGIPCLQSSTHFTIIVQPLELPTTEEYRKGIRLKISPRLRNDPRALDPAMKSGNYLNSLLAYLDARNDDFDDALLCNSEHHVTEGTTFNIFYIRKKVIATPPLDIGILDGVTRRHVIDLAKKMGLEVREVRFSKERLYDADEIFITSTIKEVLGVTQLDHHKIDQGLPGPITQKLYEALQTWLTAKLGK